MNSRLKFIWGAINKLAPLMRIEKEEYKFQLGYHAAGRLNGSIKDLNDNEFQEVKRKLEADAAAAGVNLYENEEDAPVCNPNKVLSDIDKEAADKQRKKIIALFREMSFQKWIGGKFIADMPRIYKYIKEVGYLKKELNAYTNKELPKLVSQMEKIHTEYIKSRTKKKK